MIVDNNIADPLKIQMKITSSDTINKNKLQD